MQVGSVIESGDTIGSVISGNIEREFIDIHSNMLIANAMLAAKKGGNKNSHVEAAEQCLRYAKKKIVEHKKKLKRLRELLDQ